MCKSYFLCFYAFCHFVAFKGARLKCGCVHFRAVQMLQSAKVRVIFLISKQFYKKMRYFMQKLTYLHNPPYICA